MLGLIFISYRKGSVRLTAARAIGRFWLAAALIVGAAASLACRRFEQTGANSNSQAAREITVSAAASLKDAFGEIGKQYESSAAAKINFNFGASGALQKQIESGAPVAVFASAGRPQMDALASQGLIEPGTQRDFARNVLVLVVPADSTSGPASFTDPGGSKVTRLAVGNPKTVPVGQYAQQTLTRSPFPNSTALVTASPTWPSSVTSQRTNVAPLPSSPASASPFSALRSAIGTRAPAWASARAVAAPNPDAPPATSAPAPSTSMAAHPIGAPTSDGASYREPVRIRVRV